MLACHLLLFNQPFDIGNQYKTAIFSFLMQVKSQISASLFVAVVLRSLHFISNEQGP